MNPELTTELLAKCRNDFSYFCQEVLDLEMTTFHEEIAMLPMQHRYLCVVIPTGHSKTTLYSIAYPLWRLFRESDIEICLVSSSIDQSMRILAKAQYALETNPFFSSLLPTNRMETWNKSQLTTSNHNMYYIKPFNSTARGIHPNFIVYDDLLREGDMDMRQIKETFWSIFYPRGQIKKCQHIIVGTPLSVDDLYADIERKSKKSKEWFIYRKPAVIENEDGGWVRSLWPERFSLETLKQIQSDMGEWRFEREYMCRPKAAGDALYPQELVLNCIDYDLDLGYDNLGTAYIGADFAMSTKSTGDFNVFTVVDSSSESYERKTDKGTVTIDAPVYIRKLIRYRGPTGQVESIRNLHNYFKTAKIIADSSGVGAKFVQELRESQLSVDAQDFRPANRNLLLMNLRRVIEKQRLVIPGGDNSSPLVNKLLRELSGFRSIKTKAGSETFQSNLDHDDTVMCYDRDTEILTCTGWKKFRNIKTEEAVWSLSLEGILEKARIIDIHNYPSTQRKLIAFKGNAIDLLVTPNHRMLVKESKGGNEYSRLVFKRADELIGEHFKLKKNSSWYGLGGGYITIPACTNHCNYKKTRKIIDKGDFFEFLGYYISEGSGNDKRIHLAQLKKSKAWIPMKKCLNRLGLSYRIQKDGFVVYDKQFCSHIKKIVPGTASQKKIPRFILKHAKKYLRRLFDALMLGDGWADRVYVTCSRRLKDDFMELCLKLGWSATYAKSNHYVGRKVLNGIGRHPVYFLSVSKISNEPRLNHHKKNQVYYCSYHGTLHCLTLDRNNTLYVRRNGKPVWSGNSLALAVKDISSPRKLMNKVFFGV